MARKYTEKELWEKIREARKDPKFIKVAKEFVKLTTS